MDNLTGKNIGLIICGGIACYKSLDLIRRLKEKEAEVFVILTHDAQKFITPLSAGALSHNKVYNNLFEIENNDISHIQLAAKLDLIIIAPATANKLAELAAGLANDFANIIILAANCPILCAPAMNPNMFSKASVQRNIALLGSDGFHFIGPATGALAEKNSHGQGRMSEPLEIVKKAENILMPKNKFLSGKKFIVTAGTTIENIDPVRYISNHSSGKQAFAIATALKNAGANVVVIAGKTEIPPPQNIEIITINSAQEMLQAVLTKLPCDGAIFAAAICDWKMEHIATHKLKKTANQDKLSLNLVKNPDILATIAQHKQRPKLIIGFAAETENHLKNGLAKLQDKNADIIIINNVANNAYGNTSLGSDFNKITIISKKQQTIEYEMAPKTQIAEHIISFIAQY